MIWRRILFFLLWLLSLTAISFYGGAVSYGFFFGLTLLPVTSAFYLIYIYLRFRLYQEVTNKHVVCRQAVPYYFVLQNEDFISYTNISVTLFSDFSYVEEVPDHIKYELLPGDKFRYDTKLTCKYRGEYYVGVKEVTITDFLRLFQLKYKIPAPIKATVAPRIVKLTELKVIPEITAFLQTDFAARKTEPDSGIRNYIAGDPLKTIHWKASAKEQKLITRQFTGEEKQGITIVCDTGRCFDEIKEYLPSENKILEVLLALSFFFAGNNINLNVFYDGNGLKKRTIEGIGSFENFYQEISSVCFEKERHFELLLEQIAKSNQTAESKAVFLILHQMNDKILEWIETLSLRGMIVVAYVITNDDISEYIRQSSVRTKIIAVSTEEELEGCL